MLLLFKGRVCVYCVNLVAAAGKGWEFQDNPPGKSVSAETLVRKLRWATVGVQFDWSKVFPAILSHYGNPVLNDFSWTSVFWFEGSFWVLLSI